MDRWMFAINRVTDTQLNLIKDGENFKAVLDNYYNHNSRQFRSWRAIKPFIKRWIFFWLRSWERAVFDDPVGKKLYEIFLEDIFGRKSGVRISELSKLRFLKFLYENLEIQKHPIHAEQHKRYMGLGLGLKLMKPNIFSYMVLCFPFELMRFKDFIKEYVKISVIQGRFEFILMRLKPYHNILSVYIPSGTRVLCDPRGLDTPILYKLPLRYTLAIDLREVPTKSSLRTITCPVVDDPKLTAEHNAAIEKLGDELKETFSHKGYIGGVRFEDGRVFFKDEEIQAWGPRRQRYVQTEAELNQLKACMAAGEKSGVIVRFNLLQPLAVLINGFRRQRKLLLDDLPYICHILALQRKNVMTAKKKSDQKKVIEIINEVFSDKPPKKDANLQKFLDRIEALRSADPSEDKAWDYVTEHLLSGGNNDLSHAICFSLMADTFEIAFNLWPLLTGRELTINEESGEYEEREITTRSKQALPLIDCIKDELEDLLRNVFTRHVEISAATGRIRSEPKLSQMVVDHCLNLRSDPEQFKKNLKKHLNKHYETQRKFFDEYLKGVPPESLKTIYQPILDGGASISDVVDEDIAGILALVEESRRRLQSLNTNYRVLDFIDPESVEVQIGNFEYGGEGIEEEVKFFREHEKRQFELANAEGERRKEVEKKRIMIKGGKEMQEMEKNRLKVLEEVKQVEVETQKRINDYEMEKRFGEAKLLAVENLQKGNIREYAAYTLIQAHNDGGFELVEKILEDSPNILMSISPELFKAKKTHALKLELIKVLGKDPKQVNPLTAAALLNMDLKDVAQADILKEFNKSIMDIMKNFRGFGYGGHGLINVSTSSEADCAEGGKRTDGTPCDEQGARPGQGAGQGAGQARRGVPFPAPAGAFPPGPDGKDPSSSGGPPPGH